jgi:hypothetical protein
LKTLEELAKDNPILLEELKKTMTKEQLAMTLPSEVADFEKIMFSDMQKIMLEECIALSLVNTKQVPDGTDFIRVPKELTPAILPILAEGNTITPRKFLLDKKDISLSMRWGDGFALSRDSISDTAGNVDLIQLGKENMAKEFSQGLDDYLFSVLLRETTYTAESHAGAAAHSIYTLTHSPVTTIIAVTDDSSPVVPVTLEKIDEYEGKIKIAENLGGKNLLVTYKASAHSLVQDANADATLAWDDLSNARGDMRAHYEVPRFVVVAPRGRSQLIADTKFLSAYMATGKVSPVSTFEIGEAAGLKVLESTRIPEGCALVIDPIRFVYHVSKGSVVVRTLDEPQSDAINFFFFLRAGADVVDQYSACLITNIGSLSADL